MKLRFEELIRAQPPEYAFDINIAGACLEHTIVVLDDDPTGCQTVHDIPVLFSWESEILEDLLRDQIHLFFILTNTRSLSEDDAKKRLNQVMRNLVEAGKKTRRAFTIISRSDSTLRGHYPAELDLISNHLGESNSMHCLIPAFFQGGRVTYEDVHYAREGEFLVPVSETPFSRDSVFGFRNANLKKYIEEKTNGRIKEEDVLSFSINELREEGPDWVKQRILKSNSSACIVNALSKKDLDVFSAGAWEAVLNGKKILFRTAASFINSYGCLPVKEPLDRIALQSESPNGGLIVVGSHVTKTTLQLNHLLESGGVTPLELNVQELINDSSNDQLAQLGSRAGQIIRSGKNVLLYTSRELIQAEQKQLNLDIGKIVSDALVSIVRMIDAEPSFFIAKGGITSHDLAEKGLGIRKATVIGQALPGIPVLVDEKKPQMKYIIFPGNVGDDDELLKLFKKLTQ